jgi:arylsulfatase A-like enzyme
VAKDQLCQRPVSLIDIYPTLVDLCGLPKREGLDGQGLKPLLENPDRKWDRPVVMTYGFNNHAVQKERWRYIQYYDGGQELYDHDADPNEWTNLASIPEYASVMARLAKSLPTTNVEPAGKGN